MFCGHCDFLSGQHRYITISEAQSALLEIGIDARMPARDDNVYDLCKKLPVLTNEQIEKFVSLIKSQLKKV